MQNAGDNLLCSRCFNNGNVTTIFGIALAGICVAHVKFPFILRRDNHHSLVLFFANDFHFCTQLGQSCSASGRKCSTTSVTFPSGSLFQILLLAFLVRTCTLTSTACFSSYWSKLAQKLVCFWLVNLKAFRKASQLLWCQLTYFISVRALEAALFNPVVV